MLRHTFEIASIEKEATFEDAFNAMAKVLHLKKNLCQT
jgi:hypothetical protein